MRRLTRILRPVNFCFFSFCMQDLIGRPRMHGCLLDLFCNVSPGWWWLRHQNVYMWSKYTLAAAIADGNQTRSPQMSSRSGRICSSFFAFQASFVPCRCQVLRHTVQSRMVIECCSSSTNYTISWCREGFPNGPDVITWMHRCEFDV